MHVLIQQLIVVLEKHCDKTKQSEEGTEGYIIVKPSTLQKLVGQINLKWVI